MHSGICINGNLRCRYDEATVDSAVYMYIIQLLDNFRLLHYSKFQFLFCLVLVKTNLTQTFVELAVVNDL